MAEALRFQYPNRMIRVMPFVDNDLFEKLPPTNIAQSGTKFDSLKFSFFYPADAVGHKNHVNLLKAWMILQKQGVTPKLFLTLIEDEMMQISAQSGIEMSSVGSIENIGRISRTEVLNRIAVSSAMIFPSLAETFGLPMLEARALDVPIIASERDFVRDVCVPTITFDPNSPISIARAVKRFMGADEQLLPLLDANQFMEAVLGKVS